MLAGLAALLGAGSGEAARARLKALGRVEAPHASGGTAVLDRLGSSPAVTRSACGLVAVLVLTGHAGVAVPVAVAAVACLGPARRRAALAAQRQARIARDLPRAADLMATCLRAGQAPAEAVALVCEVVGGPLRDVLVPVAAAIRLGVDPALAWADLADSSSSPGAGEAPRRLARAFARAAATGAPLADTLSTVADDERERLRWAAEATARRAGVRAVGPLAVCFLPAFLLLGVVPVVVGVAGDVLGQLG